MYVLNGPIYVNELILSYLPFFTMNTSNDTIYIYIYIYSNIGLWRVGTQLNIFPSINQFNKGMSNKGDFKYDNKDKI